MRIALVICGPLETVSGGFLYDRQLVKGFRQAGHQVDLIELPWGSYGRQLVRGLQPALLRRLRRIEADVVLQDELCHPCLLLANRLPGRTAPLVSIVHHLRAEERAAVGLRLLYRLIERAYLASIGAFIFNTRATQQSVERLLGRPAAGVVAYPAGDHLPGFGQSSAKPAADRPEQLRLLFVGNLIPRKGLDTLLTALEGLPAGAWRLDVVGRTDLNSAYADRMLGRLQAPRWRQAIHLWGQLSEPELADRYRQADLLVVPSDHEGFGIVYLEAMGFGLPVIASRAGGAGELVEHGVHGFLVPPRSPAELRRHLAGFLDTPGLLTRQGAAALARARAHPRWQRSVGLAADLLERIAAGSPSSAASTVAVDF